MHTKNRILLRRKILYGIMLLVGFLSTQGASSLSSARSQKPANHNFALETPETPVSAIVGRYVLSNGQFVYGPNVKDFNLGVYLEDEAPHLSKYADDLYGRSEYFSINPKVYLTLLEVHGDLMSNPDATRIENPFDLPDMDFISQIDYLSNTMIDAYYLHLYSYSSLPASERNLSPFITQSGDVINIASDTNAGTYAIIAALARIGSEQRISQILDNNQPDGFYRTYIKLFGNDDPIDEKNHIYIPGEAGVLSTRNDSLQPYLPREVSTLTAPNDLLQLPYLRGQSWRFGGVHSNGAGGVVGSPYTDASALDFSPGGIAWGADTSNMWVAASASGIPTKVSACYFTILHSDGWETTYYHIENIQNFSGSINQNDKIGVIANTLAEATCSGGSASGPHVHFNLKRNGALVAINGTPLSGWSVHAGRWNYDTDPNYMWLERGGVKKYANINPVLSEAPPVPPTVISSMRDITSPNLINVKFIVTFSQTVTGVDAGDFALTTTGVAGATVSGVSGSGAIYTVTVNTGADNGTIRLNVVDDDSILSLAGLSLGGIGAGNGNFTSGETYTINKNVNTYIGEVLMGSYNVTFSPSLIMTFANKNTGPVKAISTNGLPILTSQRAFYGNSFNELMGYPADQFTTEYWFPWYDNVFMQTWILVGNPHATETANVEIYIGGQLMMSSSILPNGRVTPMFTGVLNGPVRVVCTNCASYGGTIFASERSLYGDSFSEVMGYPDDQFTTEYWFPWYDNIYMQTWILVGNPSSTQTAYVDISIGGVPQGSYTIPPNGRVTPMFGNVLNGPVQVVSTMGVGTPTALPIFVSERSLYGTSFNEVMGYPRNQFTTEYYFPWYDNTGMQSWVLVGNPSASQMAYVDIYIAGQLQLSTSIPPNGRITPQFNSNTGPVRIVSTTGAGTPVPIDIFTSERSLYLTSFNEVMGYAADQLTTEYWFTWYDNVFMNTDILLSRP